MAQYRFRLAAYTDSAGKFNPNAARNGNEDNMFVCSDLSSTNADALFIVDKEEQLTKGGCLMAVADGMGGMNAGEVASEIAINVVKESISSDTINSSVFENTKTRTRFLEDIVLRADSAIKSYAEQHPECEGMGTTIVLAWLYDDKVTITWCGDSRAYLYRPGVGLRQISKDHSYVQELVDKGMITSDDMFDHPYNNVITRSLGDLSQKAKPDSVTIPIFCGDIILVNSDGLSGVLRDSEIENLIDKNHQTMSSCRTALWNAAEQAGWYDNVTAILCEITKGNTYTPDAENVTDKDLSKSFFNIRISKRLLKMVVVILSVFIVGVVSLLLFHLRGKGDNQNCNQQETGVHSAPQDTIRGIDKPEPQQVSPQNKETCEPEMAEGTDRQKTLKSSIDSGLKPRLIPANNKHIDTSLFNNITPICGQDSTQSPNDSVIVTFQDSWQ